MPINLANSNLLPFLSPRVGPTDKGREYGAKIKARFILNEMKNLTIINNAIQHDIARFRKIKIKEKKYKPARFHKDGKAKSLARCGQTIKNKIKTK